MNGKMMTRRQLAAVAAGSAAIALTGDKAIAQTPDFDKAVRESHRENSEVLAKFEIAMSVEPAFHFKA
jgi:hypothetical protein